ncbi:MAG: hypothetical protein ACI4SM_04025 [Candidatus Gastranaerophilaceae bacterium]
MSSGQSISNIRLQYNLPVTASDSDVVKFALENNITIDFSSTGNKNTTNLNDLKNNVGGSLFGATTTSTSNTSLGSTNWLENVSLSSNQATNNNTSIFGSGFSSNGSYGLSNTGLNNTSNQNVFSLASSSDVVNNKKGMSLFESLLSTSMSSFSKHPKMQPLDSLIDRNKVVLKEYTSNNQVRYTLEDGTVVEKEMPSNYRTPVINGQTVTKVEYKDGMAVHHFENGETQSIQARYGEHGYVKDGNSIDEDLVAKLGERTIARASGNIKDYTVEIDELAKILEDYSDEKIAEVEQNDPKQAEAMKKEKASYLKKKAKLEKKLFSEKESLASDYIKKVYKECNGDIGQIKAKINNLIKNSDMSSEASQQMIHIIASLDKKCSDLKAQGISEEDMSKYFSVMMSDADTAVENASAMADQATHMTGTTGHRVRIGLQNASIETGTQVAVSDALIDGMHNAGDAESATDIADIAIALNGKDAAIQVADNAKVLVGNENMTADAQKVAVNKAIDKYSATTGDKEIIQKSIDVITSMDTAEAQIEANNNAHDIYQELGADEETFRTRAAIVGMNLAKMNDEAQLNIDETERKFDIDNAYNIAVSQILQDIAVENQKELVQRTIDSGCEEAATNVANHAYEFDPANRDDIIKMLKETGYTNTMKALDEAKVKYDEQAQKDKEIAEARSKETSQAKEVEKTQKASTQKNTTKTTQSTNNSSYTKTSNSDSTWSALTKDVTKTVVSKEFKEKTVEQKKEFFNSLSQKQKKEAIGSMVENSDAVSLKNMMFGDLKNQILKYLVNHPNPQNNEKLKYLERFLSPTDKKEVLQMQEERQNQFRTNPFNLQ